MSRWPVSTTRRPGPNDDLAERVRPVGQDRLEFHRLEAGLLHDVGQERGQRPFLAEHAGNPADLLGQVHGTVRVQVLEHLAG